MDQKKIGSFLKELRKEKGITQEEFAEKLNVSGRTVSRWETGNNMPDISLLIEIAEFFDVSIPEIINGERKSENMNEEVKTVADKSYNANPTFISIDLKNGIIVDQFQKLIDFTDSRLNLIAAGKNVYIYGENLKITSYSKTVIYISGKINKIEIFEVK